MLRRALSTEKRRYYKQQQKKIWDPSSGISPDQQIPELSRCGWPACCELRGCLPDVCNCPDEVWDNSPVNGLRPNPICMCEMSELLAEIRNRIVHDEMAALERRKANRKRKISKLKKAIQQRKRQHRTPQHNDSINSDAAREKYDDKWMREMFRIAASFGRAAVLRQPAEHSELDNEKVPEYGNSNNPVIAPGGGINGIEYDKSPTLRQPVATPSVGSLTDEHIDPATSSDGDMENDNNGADHCDRTMSERTSDYDLRHQHRQSELDTRACPRQSRNNDLIEDDQTYNKRFEQVYARHSAALPTGTPRWWTDPNGSSEAATIAARAAAFRRRNNMSEFFCLKNIGSSINFISRRGAPNRK